MLNRVVQVKPLDHYRLRVEFDDGVYGTIDLSDRLFGEMFEPLQDEAMFRQVSIDPHGVLCWPNGADLAPDAIHQRLISHRFPSLADPRRRAASSAISSRDDCVEQLLQALADIDHNDIHQVAERLARVQEWITRETDRAANEPALSKTQRAAS
ncbi:MAG TPA: DUF2442 domain-containing protein [Stellaceae bacterium]|nr:DUF2442 domain-containing protein [Stellaceae bacterium]